MKLKLLLPFAAALAFSGCTTVGYDSYAGDPYYPGGYYRTYPTYSYSRPYSRTPVYYTRSYNNYPRNYAYRSKPVVTAPPRTTPAPPPRPNPGWNRGKPPGTPVVAPNKVKGKPPGIVQNRPGGPQPNWKKPRPN